jgi:YbbR domain-containing protein
LKSWFGTLKRNKLLKLLSVLLAIALWFAVSGEERIETTINMSLQMSNLQPNLMVTSELPPAIQVRVIGPRSIVNSLSQTRLSETLDLNNYKSGRHTFYLGPNSFVSGVQAIRSTQPINFVRHPFRTLPIKPVLKTTLEGYEVMRQNQTTR